MTMKNNCIYNVSIHEKNDKLDFNIKHIEEKMYYHIKR